MLELLDLCGAEERRESSILKGFLGQTTGRRPHDEEEEGRRWDGMDPFNLGQSTVEEFASSFLFYLLSLSLSLSPSPSHSLSAFLLYR